MSENERPPISDVIEVHHSRVVYKTNKWWQSVVDGTLFSKRKIFAYLHLFGDGKWKRKGKLTIGSRKNWEDLKMAIEKKDEDGMNLLDYAFGKSE